MIQGGTHLADSQAKDVFVMVHSIKHTSLNTVFVLTGALSSGTFLCKRESGRLQLILYHKAQTPQSVALPR